VTSGPSTTAVETVFRMEFPRVVATLVRLMGDIDLAEELAQDALVDALRQWPRLGTPANPAAWLTSVGKRKAVDRFRRDRTLAVFNEGYAATAGERWVRPELCAEALRLGRVLAGLAPGDAEVHGLVALMELQSSRLAARVGPTGVPVLLADQDRRRWDRLHIARGEAALRRADALSAVRGPYALQAAIAACHARAFRPEETDWSEIVALYDELAAALPSPVVELNRAVAISMAWGPSDALPLVDELASLGVLDRYHLLHSVRGDLLEKVGRHVDAANAFDRAASLAQNAAERLLLQQRAAGARSRAVIGTAPDQAPSGCPPGRVR
jgi:predicted RNA polymerase sigma factor